MNKLNLDKFCNGVGWITKEIKNTYDEEIKLDQFKSDMIGCSVILIDIGKNDFEIYDILHRYFGIEQMDELKEYVSAAHEWLEENHTDN